MSQVAMSGKLGGKVARRVEQIPNTYATGPTLQPAASVSPWKAAQWTVDNPPKRKSARGMPRFLGNWLSKAKPPRKRGKSLQEMIDESRRV